MKAKSPEVHKATARVQVLIEVECNSTWENGCTLTQVYKQAEDDVRRHLGNILGSAPGITVVGVPKIAAIITSVSR